MHQQIMQQVAGGETENNNNTENQNPTRDNGLVVENIRKSDMFEINADASTIDAASVRVDETESTLQAEKTALGPENSRPTKSEMNQPKAS